MNEHTMHRMNMRRTAGVLVLADGSKYPGAGLLSVCRADEIDTLVTNDDADARTLTFALADHGDKVGETEKTAIQTALDDLKAAKDGTDADAIREKTNTLAQASMKLGEAMYAQQQGDAAAEGQPADDGVVDAEFEEVSDTDGDEKKSA